MIKNNKKLYITLVKALLKISIAGVIIGLFHKYETILAVLLTLKAIHSLYDLGFKNGQKNWIVPIGMLLTGIGGFIVEAVGTNFGFWEYHDINGLLPHWVTLAWGLAFTFIYKIEKELFEQLHKPTIVHKILITFLLALFYPAFGEVITINLGVWTYYWPYQFLGVPLYALLGLVFFHMLINSIIYFIGKKANIKDVVFNVVSNN